MKKLIAALVASVLVLGGTRLNAEPLAKDVFGHIQNPSQGPARAIGSYSRGCLAGGVALEETGPTWQAMRLSRNRNYGHPVLVDFIKELANFASQQEGWAGLYVGDMNQPRGGPMLTGHASHQSGMDVDFWALPPQRLNLTRAERENLSSISMVSGDFKQLTNFNQGHYNILRRAAQDPRVARIFITPAVKIKMCEVTSGNPDWLGKIRPWWGHNYHFHVRLKCPSGSPQCENQTPVPAGDGCDWAEEFYGMHITKTIPVPPADPNAPTPPAPVRKTVAWLPQQCHALAQ